MILDEHNGKVSNFMDRLLLLMENTKVKEERKPIPVPVKSEAPKRIIKQILCIQKGMKSFNAEVESMSEKGDFDKYVL